MLFQYGAGFVHCLPLLENTLMLVPKGCSCSFKSSIDNKFRSFLLKSNVTEESLRKLELEEVNLAPKLMMFSVCNSLRKGECIWLLQ